MLGESGLQAAAHARGDGGDDEALLESGETVVFLQLELLGGAVKLDGLLEVSAHAQQAPRLAARRLLLRRAWSRKLTPFRVRVRALVGCPQTLLLLLRRLVVEQLPPVSQNLPVRDCCIYRILV